jgi:hypothetical protein
MLNVVVHIVTTGLQGGNEHHRNLTSSPFLSQGLYVSLLLLLVVALRQVLCGKSHCTNKTLNFNSVFIQSHRLVAPVFFTFRLTARLSKLHILTKQRFFSQHDRKCETVPIRDILAYRGSENVIHSFLNLTLECKGYRKNVLDCRASVSP